MLITRMRSMPSSFYSHPRSGGSIRASFAPPSTAHHLYRLTHRQAQLLMLLRWLEAHGYGSLARHAKRKAPPPPPPPPPDLGQSIVGKEITGGLDALGLGALAPAVTGAVKPFVGTGLQSLATGVLPVLTGGTVDLVKPVLAPVVGAVAGAVTGAASAVAGIAGSVGSLIGGMFGGGPQPPFVNVVQEFPPAPPARRVALHRAHVASGGN